MSVTVPDSGEFNALANRVDTLNQSVTLALANQAATISMQGQALDALALRVAKLESTPTPPPDPPPPPPDPPPPPPPPQPVGRLTAASFQYLGAFRLQEAWQNNNRTLEYSNAPIALLDSDTLLVGGHVYSSHLMRFKIPATFSTSKTLSQLPTAQQSGQWIDLNTGSGFIMGMVNGGDGFLYVQSNTDYPSDLSNPSAHLARIPLGALNSVDGPYKVSGVSPFNGGRYVGMWGNKLLIGRHRNSNAEGPNLYHVNFPSTLVRKLAEYSTWTGEPNGNPEGKGYGKEFNPACAYQGFAVIGDTGVMCGLQDYAPQNQYYGYEGGVTPQQCEPSGTCRGQRGHRAGDARPTFWLWDLKEIESSTAPVNKRFWYERVDIAANFLDRYGQQYLATGAEAEGFCLAYDAAKRRLYVSESYAEGTRPVVHVYEVN